VRRCGYFSRVINSYVPQSGMKGTLNVLEPRIIKALGAIVGKNHITTEKQDLVCYSYDATRMEFLPDVVVFPATAREISGILQIANTEGIPVFPRGAGSGFSGGSLPKGGGIALVTTRMNRILRIDTDNLMAEVEPGVITGDLQDAVEKEGLFYPPDPASLRFSTLGGNVAECAGGPRAVKYGVTKDYVLGLEVVLPTGDIITTGGETVKGVVGYDLTKLVCGSEGTLGVITRITLRLLPLPETRKTMLAIFESIDGAASAVAAIIRGRIIPATLEFMDRSALQCVENQFRLGIPENAGAVLIIELDGESDPVEKQTVRIEELIRSLGLISFKAAADRAEAEELWKARRLMSPALRKVNPDKINEDIVVPRSRVPEIIRKIDEIREKYQIPIINFGHAGDGNIHVNIMIDRSIPGHSEKAEAAVREIFRATLDLGGSMSGEHGVGLSKAPYLRMELTGEQIRVMKAIKKALDPNTILNPGKIFTDEPS
jgi:glycolate oxidase